MKLALAALILTAPLLLGPHPTLAAPAAFEWRSWNDGLREAKAAKKRVLVDVYTDWCRWCKVMDRDVYARAEIQQYLTRRFVSVKMNAEAKNELSYLGRSFTERSLSAQLGVKGYPCTVFLGADGERLVNVPGYVPPDRFLLILRYIGDGHMERGVSFDAFAKSATPAPAR
jgi:thioredoxin-related protein